MLTSPFLPMFLVFGGTFLSAAGALIVAFQQINSATKRAEFERELRSKTEEISALNKKIADSVIGGDSFCYLSPAEGPGNTTFVFLVNRGENTMYDVSFNIMEHDPKKLGIFDPNVNKHFDVGNVSPYSQKSMPLDLFVLTEEKINLLIDFIARNGRFHQYLQGRKLADGTWTFATRIFRYPSKGGYGDLIHTESSPRYPKNDDGSIVWE